MLRKAILLISLFTGFKTITMGQTQAEVEYRLSFPNPATHYCRVEIHLSNIANTFVNFRMPVWTPGSYKVREFARNVDFFEATNFSGEDLQWERTDKNSWKVNTESTQSVRVIYDVYCNEISVRQSYVDQYWAFIHGVSAFMRAEGFDQQSFKLKVSPYFDWDDVHMALPELKKHVFLVNNFDELADAPIALGNFDVIPFEVDNVPHKVVMIGTGNYQREVIEKDFKAICEETSKIIGEHPSKEYIHFIQNVENGGGGLEHANSQTSAIPRWNYNDPGKYKSFLRLIAHEYFHLWNVKRIRPKELGPFEYDNEIYTKQLWVAEGITSYYDDLIMKRSGYYTEEEYLSAVLSNINRLQNTEGRKRMSLAESSFLAWIELYMPDENSPNTAISYYNKGAVVALMLDLEILKATKGKKRLDDLMRYLWEEYYKKKNRGFDEKEFKDAVQKVAGKDLDDLLEKWIYSTDEIEYDQHFKHVGLKINNTLEGKSAAWIGVNSRTIDGKLMIETVTLGGPASSAGLSAGDEIVSIEGHRADGELSDILARYQVGKRIKLTYNRKGIIYECRVELAQNPEVKMEFIRIENPNELQKRLYRTWLSLPEEQSKE